MKISAKTDRGMLRQSNQDAYAIGELTQGAWAVVCDGMGGHLGGNVASAMARDVITDRIKDNVRINMSAVSVRNMLESAIVTANADIYDRSHKEASLAGMGTTCVAAVCINSVAVIANVGDSRCYLLRGDTITQLTKDHSYVQALVDAGTITPEEANEHHMKNMITRALGLEDDIDVDFFDVEITEGDRLLLCSDGLTNHVSNEKMLNLINGSEAFDYADKLVKEANKNGGTDNITVVVMEN